MTAETLKKANEIQSDIDYCKQDLMKWEKATGFETIELAGTPIRSGNSVRLKKCIDFERVKAEAMEWLKLLITELEKQFADLK